MERFFFNIYIFKCIYLFLACWVFVAVRGLTLVAVSGGYAFCLFVLIFFKILFIDWFIDLFMAVLGLRFWEGFL